MRHVVRLRLRANSRWRGRHGRRAWQLGGCIFISLLELHEAVIVGKDQRHYGRLKIDDVDWVWGVAPSYFDAQKICSNGVKQRRRFTALRYDDFYLALERPCV